MREGGIVVARKGVSVGAQWVGRVEGKDRVVSRDCLAIPRAHT